MKSMGLLSKFILAVLLGLVLAGCGGGSSPASGKKEISLPVGWDIKDALSEADMSAIVGETMASFPVNSGAKAGNPRGAFNIPNKNFSKIEFGVYVAGGEKEFESTKGFAVKNSVKDVSGIGDKAYICDFVTGASAMVILKGETVVRVDWNPGTYNKFEKVEFGKKLAGKLMEAMYK